MVLIVVIVAALVASVARTLREGKALWSRVECNDLIGSNHRKL